MLWPKQDRLFVRIPEPSERRDYRHARGSLEVSDPNQSNSDIGNAGYQ